MLQQLTRSGRPSSSFLAPPRAPLVNTKSDTPAVSAKRSVLACVAHVLSLCAYRLAPMTSVMTPLQHVSVARRCHGQRGLVLSKSRRHLRFEACWARQASDAAGSHSHTCVGTDLVSQRQRCTHAHAGLRVTLIKHTLQSMCDSPPTAIHGALPSLVVWCEQERHPTRHVSVSKSSSQDSTTWWTHCSPKVGRQPSSGNRVQRSPIQAAHMHVCVHAGCRH